MEYLIHYFPISGVKTYIFLPPLVMFIISSIVSMGGVSGAFILLPFQVSILGYTTPGVSATNFIYNIVSIPSGIYKHIKKKQMCWSLFWIILAGTIPGIFIGYHIRVSYLPDPVRFKIFAGVVLGLLGLRTIQSSFNNDVKKRNLEVSILREKIGFFRSEIYVTGLRYEFSTLFLGIVSFIVGIVGSIYGIGGGAILAPFCMSVLELPVYLVSGAALFSTWINSILGACIYAAMSYK
ncbi:MAG: sulfite exporter TauE/SafE family protein, partial [Deltaproteobacteria bacterium]